MQGTNGIDDEREQVEGATKDLLETIKHRKPSEVRAFIIKLPKHIFEKIFVKEDDTLPVEQENGTSVNYADMAGQENSCDSVKDLLPSACEKGDLETVKLLLFHELDPASRGTQGTPLEVATYHNHKEVIDVLLKCKPDLVHDIEQIKSCLAKACQGGHKELVAFWVEHLKKISDRKLSVGDFVEENDPLIAACKGGRPEQVIDQLLNEEIVTINKETITHAGEQIGRCLDFWVEEDEKVRNGKEKIKNLVAKWNKKQLHLLETRWLQLPRYKDILTNIDLSHNALGSVPNLLLWGLPWLQKLTLSHNNIDKLPTPTNMKQLDQSRLKFLTLSNNKLKSVPLELFLLSELETLSLSYNQIRKIQLVNTEISVTYNSDSKELVWRCQSLKQLDLSHNHLEEIPSGIKMATKLRKLYVACNRLTEIPATWCCPLEKLDVSHNSLASLPDIHHLCWKKSLRFLNLSQNKFTEIPLTACRLSGLLDLNLSHNAIRSLPPTNEWCTYKLSVLDLSHNALLHINTDTYLDTSENRISLRTALRNTLKKLSGDRNMGLGVSADSIFYVDLDHLELSRLQLEFPKAFSGSLCTLYLSHNKLQAFPESICDMRALQVLDLQGNPDLNRLPGKLSTLKALYNIKVDNQQIKDPPEVAQAFTAEKMPTLAIKRLLREKLHNCQSYRGVKLMIVGPEKSGKTSLMTQLIGCDWPDEDRGVNVKEWQLSNPEIRNGTLRRLRRPTIPQIVVNPDDIHFKIWDLKGGGNYALIHQTLFTPRTLYLLVWDVAEKEAGIDKLRPWVLNIQSRAPQSCIIAVGTHLDLLPKSVERQDTIHNLSAKLLQTCPEIAKCVMMEGSSHSMSEIDYLKQAIYKQTSSMKYYHLHPLKEEGLLVGRKVPHSYIVMEELLEIELKKIQSSTTHRPPIMTEAELTRNLHTIPQSQLKSSDEADAAVRFLRDTGSLTHVSDHTYQLTNLYFLDPAWLCDVLHAVVTFKSQEGYAQDGMVLNAHLKKLCVESGFGESRFEEYLQLLGRFEIALAVSPHRCLIPSLLPKRPPVIQQIHARIFTHKVQRLYKMAYIPPGFWSRLVSRLMVSVRQMEEEDQCQVFSSVKRFSQDISSLWESQSTTLVWQEGMSVNHGSGQISLEPMSFPDDGKNGIRVTVRSKTDDFKALGFVIDHIESLIKEWYPGLMESEDLVERLVPCPVCEKRSRGNASPYGVTNIFSACTIFAFKDLAVSATLRGQDNVSCDRHQDEDISLKAVVPDLFLSDLGVDYLDESKLIMGRKLGQGGFGEVYKAYYKGKPIAVKRLLKLGSNQQKKDKGTEITDEEIVTVINTFPNLRSELAIMSQLDHPCILKVIGVSIHQLCFAMEFAPLGDLASFINEQYISTRPIMLAQKVLHETILPRMLTYKIALQITAAIAYIHQRRVIHTDLKTDNILLFSRDTDDFVNVKLADYGISRNLVVGGVRGKAGFHAFCAPEIVKGKAFDEKADLFSLGMLFYHLMSGIIPFNDDESSAETKISIATGTRPKFDHFQYTMLPRFAHLEGLMRACWQDSPIDRPSAKAALECMQDASFLCLRHTVDVESESEACLYTRESAGAQDEEDKCSLWLWKKNERERCVTAFNFEYNTAHQETKEWPGDKVLCAVQFGEYHVLGTRSEKLEMYKYNFQSKRLTHQTNLTVPIPATSVYYQRVTDKDSDTLGYLYAGLEDGSLLIYSHNSTMGSSTRPQKRLLLSVEPKPCHCMLMLDHRQELLIGCGNTVRILNLKELLLDQEMLVVTPFDEQHVQGMTSHGNMVWCFVENSGCIAQYDISERQLVGRFHCSSMLVMKGQCLAIPVDVDSTTACSVGPHTLPVSPSTSIKDNPFKERETVGSSRPKSLTSSVMRRAKFAAGRQRSRSTGDLSACVEVTSLLVVKDTLWIGRADGNILVVGIDSTCCSYRFGELLAVLSPNSMLRLPNGPVTKLFSVGLDRVVACRDIKPDETPADLHQVVKKSQRKSTTDFLSGNSQVYNLIPKPYRYQLLVWEDWGSQELIQFENTHAVLNS